MLPDPSPETWTQIRYEYEHTDKPVDDICSDHGISPGTLRDRFGLARPANRFAEQRANARAVS